MARYRKLDLRTWNDQNFRELSPLPCSGQSVWLVLVLGPQTTNIPGLFECSEVAIADRFGWELEAFRKAFLEASSRGMVVADWKARLVWLPKAPLYNKPESPNVVKSWGTMFDELPECGVKVQAYQSLKAFAEGWGRSFEEAFHEAFRKPSAKAMPNQEQEQKQKQEQEQTPTGARENVSCETENGKERKLSEAGVEVTTGRQLTPEAAMAIALRNSGVKVNSMHPTLVAWVQDKFTLDQLMGALAIARTAQGDDAEIHANYLDTILRNPKNWPAINRPKPNGSNSAPPRFRSTDELEADEIKRSIRDGLSDDEISGALELVPIERIRAIRQEVERAGS
jgi:hypothetical protein